MNPNDKDMDANDAWTEFIENFSEEYGGLRLYSLMRITMDQIEDPDSFDSDDGSDFEIDGDLY